MPSLSHHQMHLEPDLQAALDPYGIKPDGSLIHRPPGSVILQEPDRHVWRLDLPGRWPVYLKWSGREKLSRMLMMGVRFCRPCCAAMRELALIKRLRQAGLPAARPVGWGQRRVMGLPASGFIITEAVLGQELDQTLAHCDEAQRRHLWEKMGQLLGRLHRRGFFHIVRVKDLIVAGEVPAHETLWTKGDLVLIDREVAIPRPKGFSLRRCSHALARCLAKHLRAGHALRPQDIKAFLHAYRRTLGSRQAMPMRQLVSRVEASMGKIRKHRRYAATPAARRQVT